MATDDLTRWGVVCGAWGDVICSLQNYRDRVGTGGVIHYGVDPNVVAFLKEQDFISDAIQVTPANHAEYERIFHSVWGNGGHLSDELRAAVSNHGANDDRLVGTTSYWDDAEPRQYGGPLKLSQEAEDWARSVSDGIARPWYVVNPYSFNSTHKEAHWHHWYEFMHTLFGGTDHHYFLTGQGWSPQPFEKHVNVHSFVNKTPSMMHVLALARLADGVVTTSNSLAHWAVSQNLRSLIVCNNACSDTKYFFHRILQPREPNARAVAVSQDTPIKAVITRMAQDFGVQFNASMPFAAGEFKVPKDFSYVFMPESRKFGHLVAPFLTGDGLDLGAGGSPVHTRAITMDRSDDRGQLVGDASDLKWFKDGVFDYVFSSHLLEDFADWTPVLVEWMRVVKPGGYLVLQIPDHARYRAFVMAGQGDNPDHHHEGRVGELSEHVEAIGGWDVVMDRHAHPADYNILFVAQRHVG
jgi:predicted SAM-dependent methyltransferase